MSGRIFEVKGGGLSGGLLVRTGKDTKSEEHPDGRLAKGSLIAELELDGERLYYTLLSGAGPLEGWISTMLKGKDLLVEVGAPGSRLYKEEEEVKAAVALSKTEGADSRRRIWLMPAGTRGDVQPMIALGIGFRKAGYHVRVLGGNHAKAMSEAAGLSFTEQGVDCKKYLDGFKEELDSNREKFNEQAKEDQSSVGAGLLDKMFNDEEMLKKSAQVINNLLNEEIPDIIFMHGLNKCLGFIARARHKVPVYTFEYFAVSWGPMDADPQKAKDIAQSALDEWGPCRKLIIEAIGIDPLEGFTVEDYIDWRDNRNYAFCTRQCMRAFDDELQYYARACRSEEWINSYWKGYLIIDPATQTKDLSSFGGVETLRKILDFIKAGSKPVYLGWGSMPVPTPFLLKLFVALKMCKYRCIVCAGWAGYTIESICKEIKNLFPEDMFGLEEFAKTQILIVQAANHEWLFPRCAFAVHHGGAGTTAASMRAGMPTLITPCGVDQFFFADFVEKIGIGGKLSIMENADKMMDPNYTKTLRKLYTSKEITANAKEFAAQIRAESEKTVPSVIEEIGQLIDKQQATKAQEAAS